MCSLQHFTHHAAYTHTVTRYTTNYLKLIQFSIQNSMYACTKIVGGRGSAPNPLGELTTLPQALVGFWDFLPITLPRLKFPSGYAPEYRNNSTATKKNRRECKRKATRRTKPYEFSL